MFGHWMIYVGARLALCLVQAMRIETCQTLSRWLAHLAYDVLRLRRPVIDDNLRHAFPDQSPAQIRRVALGMWEHVILMVCELAHVPRKLHDTNWRDYVRMSDADMQLLLKHLLSPRPVVIVSGHFGNFEVGGIVAGLLGFPTFTVARPLDNPYLHRFVTRFREATGQFMLPKRGSAAQLDAILQAGGTMVLLGDQAAGPKGCWVEFFGRPASCHKAVALFSLVNRAPLLLGYSRRERPMRFVIGVSAEFDPLRDPSGGVRELTQWYNKHLELTIRTAPDQYWWLHNRWKSKPARASKTAARRLDTGHVPSAVGPRKPTPAESAPQRSRS